MAQRVVMYQAADGSYHDTEEEARLHDMRNALIKQAHEFCETNINYRTVQKGKVEKLLVEFAMQLLNPEKGQDS